MVCSPSIGMSSKMKRHGKSPSVGYPCSAPPSRLGPEAVPATRPDAKCLRTTTIPPQQQRFSEQQTCTSTSTTQHEVGGSTDVETGWQGRCDHRREQRDRAGDPPTGCSRGRGRVYYPAPPERGG